MLAVHDSDYYDGEKDSRGKILTVDSKRMLLTVDSKRKILTVGSRRETANNASLTNPITCCHPKEVYDGYLSLALGCDIADIVRRPGK